MNNLLKQRVAGVGDLYVSPNGLLLPDVKKALEHLAKPGLAGGMAKAQKLLMLDAIEKEFPNILKTGIKDGAEARKVIEAAAKELATTKKARESTNAAGQLLDAVRLWLSSSPPKPGIADSFALTDASKWAYMAFEDYVNTNKILPFRVNETIFDEGEGYVANNVNIVMNDHGNKLIALHVVVGKAIYDDHLFTAAANFCAAKNTGIPVNSAMVLRLPKDLEDPEFEAKALAGDELLKWSRIFQQHMNIWRLSSGYMNVVKIDQRVIAAPAKKVAAHG